MKLIKFDLPLNGTKVKNIEELRVNFTAEILEYLHDGRLAKWLKSRNMNTELLALASLEDLDDDTLPKRLCEIFQIEADDFMTSARSETVQPEQVEVVLKEAENEAIAADKIILNQDSNAPSMQGGIGMFRIKALYAYTDSYVPGTKEIGAVSRGGLVYSRIMKDDDTVDESAAPTYEWLATSRSYEMLGQRVLMLLENRHERFKLSGSEARRLDDKLTKAFMRILSRQLSVDILSIDSFAIDVTEAIGIMAKHATLAAVLPGLRKAEAEFIINHTFMLTGDLRKYAIENYETLILPKSLTDAEKKTIELTAYPALGVQLGCNADELNIDIAVGQTRSLVMTEHKKLATLAATLVNLINPLTNTRSSIVISTLDGYSFELDKGFLDEHFYLITRRNA